MIFSWFDATDAEKFGEFLADFFMQRVPLATSKEKNKSFRQRAEILSKLFTQLEKFKKEKKLNFYKKAKLGNAFKWKLKEAGYESDFVDQLTHALIQKL
jgi:hypothetical protein